MTKFLICALLLFAGVAQAETYTWTDKQGTVHFSDSLQSVPSAYRKSARPLGLDTSSTGSGNAAATSRSAAGSGIPASNTTDIEALKNRMMNDQGIMALITALQSDPEMQALLGDPAVLSAVQSGDYGALMNNPTFMKLLNNPRVRQIQQKLQQGGAN